MKKIILIIFMLSAFSACQSVKDGLTGKKQNNSDEFLIKKKNPLILPPEYGKLPKPGDQKVQKDETKVNELEILLKKNKSLENEIKSETTNKKSVEEFILDKIKNK
tara:strand:+ start:129 stop:446 length:318 start_codon:yes stop_codon:yes gene_type:complete